jgi:hypothetical protein
VALLQVIAEELPPLTESVSETFGVLPHCAPAAKYTVVLSCRLQFDESETKLERTDPVSGHGFDDPWIRDASPTSGPAGELPVPGTAPADHTRE